VRSSLSKPSSAQLLWIIDIYRFFVAGSLMTMGTLGDRIGRRMRSRTRRRDRGSASPVRAGRPWRGEPQSAGRADP
jgi:hypothetical protein